MAHRSPLRGFYRAKLELLGRNALLGALREGDFI
jgi:hypothetical protein